VTGRNCRNSVHSVYIQFLQARGLPATQPTVHWQWCYHWRPRCHPTNSTLAVVLSLEASLPPNQQYTGSGAITGGLPATQPTVHWQWCYHWRPPCHPTNSTLAVVLSLEIGANNLHVSVLAAATAISIISYLHTKQNGILLLAYSSCLENWPLIQCSAKM